MRWREQIQSKEEDRMASGGRKKLFGSVISGAPFIKGLQLLNHGGEDSFSLRFIWFKKGILVEFYYGLYILNWDEMSWLMITNTITLNHWINCHVFNFIYKRIFVTKKYVCCRKSFLLPWPGAMHFRWGMGWCQICWLLCCYHGSCVATGIIYTGYCHH